jgi:group I intron endonuclease
MGFIYILTFPNMKSYVGQTTRRLSKRFSEHRQEDSNCILLKRAIDKYGWDSITIITNEMPNEKLDDQEEFLIDSLRTLSPNGYNLRGGGSRGKDSQDTCERKSEAAVERMKSEEARQKISIGVKKGNRKGRNHTQSKITYQYSLDGVLIKEHASANEAARDIGGLQSNISSCARGDIKSAYGFKWSYITE